MDSITGKKKAIAGKSKKLTVKKAVAKKTATKVAKKVNTSYIKKASAKKKKTPLTAADIYRPRLKSSIAVYQVIETLRRLRKINPDITKILPEEAKKYAAKKK